MPNIIFNDENLLILNKPSGLLSIRDHKHPNEKTAIDFACEFLKVKQVYPVHRIDKDTSGVLIVAKTPYAQKNMSDIIYRRQMRKIYLALVTGEVRKDGKINLPVLRTKSGKVKIDKKGKLAFTIYRIKKRFKGYTLLEVEPKTGRTHQIRVHLASIGHPLAYDRVYGSRKPLIIEKDGKEVLKTKRLTLHCSEVMFKYCWTNKLLNLKAEIPVDFKEILNIIDKYMGSL